MTITLADRTTSFAAATVEREAREIGRGLFAEVGRGPSPRERGYWDDRLMDLTMGDPEVKVQLFRFIDAFPRSPPPRTSAATSASTSTRRAPRSPGS